MIGLFIIFLLSLGRVAFITLMERKTLGLSQVRLGPNKTTIFGVVQPVFDGVKLLIKFLMTPLTAQLLLMLISPALILTLFVVLWGVLLA
jgi:NADH-quinone oxidoreductase subunit H